MSYRFVEHTADLGIEVRAESLERLFGECLKALTDCMTRLGRVRLDSVRGVQLQAADLPQLLVAFLGEAIYLFETQGLVFGDAKISIVETVDACQLEGELAGEGFDLERHGLKTMIKAVTYHQLAVEGGANGWFARVIFDI